LSFVQDLRHAPEQLRGDFAEQHGLAGKRGELVKPFDNLGHGAVRHVDAEL
jgi:hypothetical protein